MENKAEYKYLTIPLPIIQRIYTHPKTALQDIVVIGIYKTGTYEKVDINNALQQLMYCYYRKREELTNELEVLLEKLVEDGDIIEDEDYNGFSGANFYVEREYIEGLYSIIENDDNIKEQIIRWHQIRQALSFFDIQYGVEGIINLAQEILSELPEGKTLVTIKIDMITDYRDSKKSAYEIDLLVCYLAIRSIIGIKTHGYTTKKAVLMRMVGCNSLADEADNMELKNILKNKTLKAVYNKYSSISKLDKLIKTLVHLKFITKIGMKELRRTYFSTKLNLQELEEAVKTDLLKTPARKIAENTKAEQEASRRILEALKPQKAKIR